MLSPSSSLSLTLMHNVQALLGSWSETLTEQTIGALINEAN
jgi:hypothetical protein